MAKDEGDLCTLTSGSLSDCLDLCRNNIVVLHVVLDGPLEAQETKIWHVDGYRAPEHVSGAPGHT